MNYRYRTSSISFGGPLTPVVRNIIIACVAVYVVQLLVGDPISRYFSLIPALVIHEFYFWQFFTYMFLHDRGGLFHLLFNMLSLFMFGCELERYWGSRRFFQYYCLTGIGAGLCVFLIPSNYLTSTIGASGAIYGVLLAYGLTFPDRVLYMYMLFPLQAKYFVMIIGGIAFLTALSSSNSWHLQCRSSWRDGLWLHLPQDDERPEVPTASKQQPGGSNQRRLLPLETSSSAQEVCGLPQQERAPARQERNHPLN